MQNVLTLTNNGVSNYNGLTAAVQEQLTHGFSGSFSYTFSHTLDNASNGGILPYSFNNSLLNQLSPFSATALNYSNADYDVRHSLNANYVWDLPVKLQNRALNAIVGGWTVSGTFFYRTGLPFSVVDGTATGNIANGNLNLFNATVLGQPIAGVALHCGASAVDAPCLAAAQFATAPTTSGPSPATRSAARAISKATWASRSRSG